MQTTPVLATPVGVAPETATMKAFVYQGPGEKSWQSMPVPVLRAPTDAIIRIEKTTICGTDLHILKGDVPTCTPGRVLGHEGVGVVEDVGSAVRTVRTPRATSASSTPGPAHTRAVSPGCTSVAAACAEGATTIDRIYHLDRGYDRMERKLGALGGQIERLTENSK